MDSSEPRPRAATTSRHRLHLPEEALEQLDSLIAAYDRMRKAWPSPLPGDDATIAELKNKIREKALLWWTDLVQAEMCLLDVTEDSALRSRLIGWRARMHDVVGDARFAVYLSNAPNLTTNVPFPALRADLGEIIRTVYYFYTAYGISARSRTRASVYALRTAAYIVIAEGVIALVLALLANVGKGSWFTIPSDKIGALEFALAASVAAVLGSVVSVQRRIQNPGTDADPFYRYIQTTSDWVGIAVIPPLFGAIFGLVMYALLVSGLMLQPLVKFGTPGANPVPNGMPTGPTDIALVLLLGFLAGFAEQLIPDALTRLAARALNSVSSTAVTTSAAGAQPAPKKPTVTAISPPSAPAGTPIGLTGTGFSGASLTVKFGAVAAASPKADGDTKLSVTSPPGSGTVSVTVTTDAGTSDPSSATSYTYSTA
jgi:IPT/TIG domain-containing protein